MEIISKEIRYSLFTYFIFWLKGAIDLKKLLKKLSLILMSTLVISMILTSCATTKGVKEDVKKGSEDVTQGVKDTTENVKEGAENATEGVKDATENVKEGAENIVDKAALVGTWKGTKVSGEDYKITLFADSVYEIVELSGKKELAERGKYSFEGDTLIFTKEKKMEDNKESSASGTKKMKFTHKDQKLTLQEENSKEKMTLIKEKKIGNKKFK